MTQQLSYSNFSSHDSDDSSELLNNYSNNKENIMNKKRRTIRRRQKINNNNSKVKTIKEMLQPMNDDSDDEGDLADFNPPPMATSAAGERIDNRDSLNSAKQTTEAQQLQQTNDDSVDVEGYNNLSEGYTEQYMNQYVPYYQNVANISSSSSENISNSEIKEKLNYLIHLIEEQKDEKVGHVAEELILYSFLGVFVIYIVDSFARVGKYVR